MSNEQVRWLLKVIQPERTLASLPGGASLGQEAHAALLGLPVEIYAAELGRMQQEASEAAGALLADQAVASMVDRLPLRKGAKVVVFGDSLTSEPQSWAVILREMLAMRRDSDGISLTISAVAGETTTHALVRAGQIANFRPDWILFLLGTNDARTQGTHPTKTLVHHEETARNIAELRQRVSKETTAKLHLDHPARGQRGAGGGALGPGQVRGSVPQRRPGASRQDRPRWRRAGYRRLLQLGESASFRPAHGRRPAFHSGGPEANGTRSDPWLEHSSQ